MATCTFSTTIHDYQGQPLSGVDFFVKVYAGVVGGLFVQQQDLNFETDRRGVVRFRVVQGATITVSGEHPSFASPVTVTVPAQSSYDLSTLANLGLTTPPPSGLGGLGTTNQVVGMNSAGNALEYKSLLVTAAGAVTFPSSFTASLPSSTSAVFGPASQRLTYNPYSTDTVAGNNSGGSVLLFEPTYHYTSSSDYRIPAIFVRPKIGVTTGGEGFFWTAYNLKHGDSTNPVPAGTKGMLCGYESNIDTLQAGADLLTGEGAHGIGFTGVTRGGARMHGTDITLTINNVAAIVLGHTLNITKNVSGGTQYGFYASATGAHECTAAFVVEPVATFTVGLALNGHSCSYATNFTFAQPYTLGGAATDYSIVGSETDYFRITGGGSVGGIGFYADNASGDGYFLWRNNAVAEKQVMTLVTADPATNSTAMLLMVNKAGVVVFEQVVLGATGSGGTGLRALCVAN